MLREDSFYRFVREERYFCSILAHLLMQNGPNLRLFLDLVTERIDGRSKVEHADLQDTEIYLEFSFLRDQWNSLGRDNEAKRGLIATLLSRVPELQRYRVPKFPGAIADFNAFFIGTPGNRIRRDISSPGRWRVAALSERFGGQPELFRGLCKFKWSFNIKPDIVVLIPGQKPLCIEAKLESAEGQYPANSDERVTFDQLFGRGQGRVGQIELQQFMFSVLLDSPSDSIFLRRNPGGGALLTWHEVFDKLDLSSSVEFVSRLVEGNRHLKPTRPSPVQGQP